MADLIFNRGKLLSAKGLVSTSAAYRVMLVTTCFEEITHATLLDKKTVDDGTTDDPLSYELTVGGYSRGSPASLVTFEDDTNDFSGLDADDLTFSALAAGESIGGAVLYTYTTSGDQDGGAATTTDTGQDLLAFYDLATTPTNGGDVTIQWAAQASGGFIKFGSTS